MICDMKKTGYIEWIIVKYEAQYPVRREGGGTMARNTIRTLLWIAWSLCLPGYQALELSCGHPPVPAGATYLNVTGGLGQSQWVVRYICDNGKNYNKQHTDNQPEIFYSELHIQSILLYHEHWTKQPQRYRQSWSEVRMIWTKHNVITHLIGLWNHSYPVTLQLTKDYLILVNQRIWICISKYTINANGLLTNSELPSHRWLLHADLDTIKYQPFCLSGTSQE